METTVHECPITVFPPQIRWETEGTSRIPFQAYTDEALYRKELDRFFYRSHWSYVGLEAEIPNAGDFKRTVVGERSVLMVRDKDGSINARFFDSNGKLLDQHGPAIDPDFPFWRKYTFKAKVPEGARRMDVPFLHRSVPGVTWVDRVSVSDGKQEFVQNGSLESVK